MTVTVDFSGSFFGSKRRRVKRRQTGFRVPDSELYKRTVPDNRNCYFLFFCDLVRMVKTRGENVDVRHFS